LQKFVEANPFDNHQKILELFSCQKPTHFSQTFFGVQGRIKTISASLKLTREQIIRIPRMNLSFKKPIFSFVF